MRVGGGSSDSVKKAGEKEGMTGMQGLFALWLLIAWFVGTLVVGYVAVQKGRSGWLWTVLSLVLISPLLALLALAALPSHRG